LIDCFQDAQNLPCLHFVPSQSVEDKWVPANKTVKTFSYLFAAALATKVDDPQ